MKHLIVMAGGTGGHIYPGLAVARAMRQRGWRVSWLGTPDGMETKLVDHSEFPLKTIAFEGIVGRGIWPKLRLPFSLLRAVREAKAYFSSVRPDAVIGMGGFPSVPGGLAAWRMSIPLAIHQSDAIAGAANRLLARFAKRILTGFDGTFANTPIRADAQVINTGNPIRNEFSSIALINRRSANRAVALRLIVMGGSRGATALNSMIPEALSLIPEMRRPVVTHQCGAGTAEATRNAYEAFGVTASVVEFINEPWQALADADVYVGRSGASTVSELAAVGLPAILIPYPHHADQQQLRNARVLASAGAAIIIEQKELTAQRLAAALDTLNPGKLTAMAERARTIARPAATVAICDAIESMTESLIPDDAQGGSR